MEKFTADNIINIIGPFVGLVREDAFVKNT